MFITSNTRGSPQCLRLNDIMAHIITEVLYSNDRPQISEILPKLHVCLAYFKFIRTFVIELGSD